MDYKVVAKEGVKIPFKFLREGKVFNSSKTSLTDAMIKKMLAEGKIEYADAEMQTAFLEKLKAEAKAKADAEAKQKAEADAKAKAVKPSTTTNTKK